jgi:hypothetical protein
MWFEPEPEVYEDLCPPGCDCDREHFDDEDQVDRQFADTTLAVWLGIL